MSADRSLTQAWVAHHRKYQRTWTRHLMFNSAMVLWSLSFYWFDWITADSTLDLALVIWMAVLTLFFTCFALNNWRRRCECVIQLRHIQDHGVLLA